MRIGYGYDAHRLAAGRRLVLGGVTVPYHMGLQGHSDADALTHAVADALLGAAGLGDIGEHFPDDDPAYEGVDSLALLRRVGGLLDKSGFAVVNLDATIVAQKPKLQPYAGEMRRRLAEALGVAPDSVNVKATTEEGMGFTGSGQGIAAHAVALVRSRKHLGELT